jgi:flagellar protein FlaG
MSRESQRDLQFQVDDTTGITVITVRDATTKEVVRQIPAEEVLAVSRVFEATGTLFDVRV